MTIMTHVISSKKHMDDKTKGTGDSDNITWGVLIISAL